jgi:5-methylcytosine-specific restriction enzyme subunit McrC
MGERTHISAKMSSEFLIKNVYYMLSYVWKALSNDVYKKIEKENIEPENFDNIYNLFAVILSKGIESQLRKGLYRNYVDQNEAMSSLRGKIDINESIKLNIKQIRKLYCLYDELSENIYMNKILKTTIRFLLNKTDLDKGNIERLKRVDRYFSDIDQLIISEIQWDKIYFHQNNYTYQILMAICRLVLTGYLLPEDKGSRKLPTFRYLLEKYSLYEKFILEYYKKHYPKYTHSSQKKIGWNLCNVDKKDIPLPEMQADVFIESKERKRKLIIDAKYYSKIMHGYYDKKTFHSANLYQIYTYVKNEDKDNSGKVDGLLLYADTGETGFSPMTEIIGGNKFSVEALNLNIPFCKIKEQLNNIIVEWKN